MFRHIAAVFLSLTVALFPTAALADEEYPVDVSGLKAAVLMEQSCGGVVIDYNGGENLEVGGLTRLPALLAVCRKIDQGEVSLDEKVTISAAASKVKGPTAFLEANETAEVSTLLKAAVMICAGDAIYALAESVYGSAEACSIAAGEILKEIGIDEAYNGLDGEGAYSALELAAIGAELAESQSFNLYSSLYYESIEHDDGRLTELASSNKLLKNCVGTYGVATGSSKDAGYCGVFTVKRGESKYVCIILGAPNSDIRAERAQKIVEYGYAAYDVKTLSREGEIIREGVAVEGGVISAVDLIALTDTSILVPKGAQLDEKEDLPETLSAPLTKGESIGSIHYYIGEEQVGEMKLGANVDVVRAGISDYVDRLLLQWIHS